MSHGKKFCQFFILNAVTVNSEKFKQRIAELQARFKVTDAKTQELLEDLRETIKTVEGINFED
jgi:GR25 family glycosyltransferase involved in LPS biosynthesis